MTRKVRSMKRRGGKRRMSGGGITYCVDNNGGFTQSNTGMCVRGTKYNCPGYMTDVGSIEQCPKGNLYGYDTSMSGLNIADATARNVLGYNNPNRFGLGYDVNGLSKGLGYAASGIGSGLGYAANGIGSGVQYARNAMPNVNMGSLGDGARYAANGIGSGVQYARNAMPNVNMGNLSEGMGYAASGLGSAASAVGKLFGGSRKSRRKMRKGRKSRRR